MVIFNYNSNLHKFKDLHDETGGKLKEFDFKYYDCFCGCGRYRIIANTTRHRNHFDIVQCQQCGTLRTNPYLSDRSIEQYYKEVYGPVKRGDITPEALFARQARSSAELHRLLKPFLRAGAKIVDYGSGAGGRMKEFKETGFDVYIHDYDRNYFDYGLKQGMKPFSRDQKYDLIVLSHVIEHINHPVAALHDMISLVMPGGFIYIEVPLIESRKSMRRLLGDFHLAHKFYFTRESLTHLANMAEFKKTQDLHNAILITPGQADAPISLIDAMKKSNRCMARASRNEQLTKLKKRIVSTFRK